MPRLESRQSSEDQDSNYQPKKWKKNKVLHLKTYYKNYPKNILISMLKFLKSKGYQLFYQNIGLYEQQIQNKNSASLEDIYNILSHLNMIHINRYQFELYASIVILQNSKIMMKYFHLRVLRRIFSLPSLITIAQFKELLTNNIQKLYSEPPFNLPIFSSQSSTIYLITLLTKLVKYYPKLGQKTFFDDRLIEQKVQSKIKSKFNQKALVNPHKHSRELIKPVLKVLKEQLNHSKLKLVDFQRIYKLIFQIINQLKQKISGFLIEEVVNLQSFCPQVLKKCMQILQNGKKISTTELYNLVKDFQVSNLAPLSSHLQIQEPTGEEYNSQQKEGQIKNVNIFQPIVLIGPSRGSSHKYQTASYLKSQQPK